MENSNLKKMRRAFSLVEFSIVILIVGFILSLLLNSSNLADKMHMQTAQDLTNDAPMASMKNLVMWLETTSQKSFNYDQDQDGKNVLIWNDINPLSTEKHSAYQEIESSAPTYIEHCINMLPCLRFNGVSSFFDFDGSILVQTDYSIIVVEQRRSNGEGHTNYFIAGADQVANGLLHLGYRDNETITFAQYYNDSNVIVAGYVQPVARVHSFLLSADNGRHYYLNGQEMIAESDKKTYLQSYNSAKIGSYGSSSESYYNGDLAEIIMFNRELENDEREAIESYLFKKWKIKL